MVILFIFLPLLIIDQLTKFIIVKNFYPGESLPVIKGIFHITLVLNKGIAFGMFAQTGVFLLLWIFLCVLITILIFNKHKSILPQTANKKITRIYLSLILAGATGNLIDRLRFGCVVDFLDLRIWPVFNVADMAISIAAGLLIIQMLRHKEIK
ncbi:MAG: signal peptidase II [Candidatus Omnitrophota bacterium]